MARRRMIDPSFWFNEDIARLSGLERLMVIGMFSNADCWGRGYASPANLRATIFRFDDITLAEIERMRDRLVEVGKVKLRFYEVDGTLYYVFLNWKEFQKVDHPTPSTIPEPPFTITAKDVEELAVVMKEQDLYPIGQVIPLPTPLFDIGSIDELVVDEQLADNSRLSREVDAMASLPKEDRLREERVEEVREPPDATAEERQILSELKSIINYPFDYAKDLNHIRKLAVDYPRVDLLREAKKYATWTLDKPLKAKANPRSQFRNWCDKASEDRRTPPRKEDKPDGIDFNRFAFKG